MTVNLLESTFLLVFFFFLIFMATPGAYGSSWAKGRIGAAPAAGACATTTTTLDLSCPQPLAQLVVTPDP